jgi:TRAP-type C4-dicarboxylate transport system permease small subunit
MSAPAAVPQREASFANPFLRGLQDALLKLNAFLMYLSVVALLLTSVVLTYAVVARYFFKSPTDWQDEASVFMLVGATFLTSGFVQAARGHVGIEAVGGLLPPRLDRVRRVLIDLLSLLFCAFFCWKSWTLLYEAAKEGQTTTSALSPPLWIPYGLMASGMTVLVLQLLLQSALHFSRVQPPAPIEDLP